MNKVWTIYKREMMAIIHSPLSAILGTCFIGISGYMFSYYLTNYNQVDFFPILLRYMANLLLIMIPLFTMSLLAGEAERGSIFLLLSSPVSEWAIVLGKWSAIVTAILFFLLLSGVFPAILCFLGTPDRGPILAGYLGITLLGALFCSVGMFSSSLSSSPVIGAITGFALMHFLGIIEQAKGFTGETAGAVFEKLSYIEACKEMFGGVIYGHHIIYFMSLTFFFLFATKRVLSSNRWR